MKRITYINANCKSPNQLNGNIRVIERPTVHSNFYDNVPYLHKQAMKEEKKKTQIK